jgi:Cell wall-associated hydrolases (invasion-associated proteins)
MLKLKRLFTAIAAVAVTVGVLAVSVSASSTTTGTVRVGTYLKVRSAGNTGAPVIGKLYNGAQVTILDNVNGWDKITYNGKTAWISGLYVTAGKAQIVVSAAKSQLGVPYKYGGQSPYTAFDCSGLTMYAYSKAGISLPHSAAEQATHGWWVSRYSLQPGDLLFFNPGGDGIKVTHCGIYIGNNMFISAQSGAGKVMEANLTSSYWSNAFVTARRIIS